MQAEKRWLDETYRNSPDMWDIAFENGDYIYPSVAWVNENFSVNFVLFASEEQVTAYIYLIILAKTFMQGTTIMPYINLGPAYCRLGLSKMLAYTARLNACRRTSSTAPSPAPTPRRAGRSPSPTHFGDDTKLSCHPFSFTHFLKNPTLHSHSTNNPINQPQGGTPKWQIPPTTSAV